MNRTKLLIVGVSLLGLANCEPVADTSGAAEPATTGSELATPAGLTADQQLIWNSMTPQARAQAIEFIANDGTFAQFVEI